VLTAKAADGASIAYETRGAGPSLVLVHGITESHHSWDPLVGELALDFRVVAVDLRGHGDSERLAPYDALTLAGDLHAVVEAVGARDPLMVGHSLGAAVVSVYTGMFPVRGTVAVDQALDLSGFKTLLTEFEPMLRGDEATFRSVMDGMFASLYGPLPPEERTRIAEHAHPEQEVVLGVWERILTTDAAALDELVRSVAGAISTPFLALHGSDPGTEYRAWLEAAIPTATMEIWDGDAHYLHLVEPKRFLDRVHDFEHGL
jgi:pimeloyl-ACP methyl ester carboxylesterase